MAATLCVASALLLWRALERPSRIRWAAYLAVAAAAVWSDYFSAVALAGLLAAVAWRRPDRRTALGMRWLIDYSRARGEKTMADRLANELVSASKGEGNTIKKKEDTHRMAEANKAFAHYRW